MSDAWADDTGCWADMYDDDHEEMQAGEANPDPKSALGLGTEHEAKLWAGATRLAIVENG